MGWKSTMEITRARALREINMRLLGASDDKLENVLEDLIDHNDDDDELFGRNFLIVASRPCGCDKHD